MLLGEKRAVAAAEAALARSKADETEVLLWSGASALTRFANNEIHQNVSERNVGLTVRVVKDKRAGVASANSFESEVVAGVVERALEVARFQPERPDLAPLPEPKAVAKVRSYVQRTADFGAMQRAQAVGVVCRKALDAGLVASGAFQISVSELTIANCRGLRRHHRETLADVSTVVMSDSSAGYADYVTRDVAEIDIEALAERALGKALAGRNPKPLEPGRYDVVLEEPAVGDILDFLAYLGFGARAYQEGRSFMCGNLGKQVVSPKVSIWDDGLDASGMPMPFDYEGVPKQRVDFIRDGIALGVCYDSQTASRDRRESTGHALPPPNTYGPFPTHLFMRPGDASLEEMIAGTERGLLVTRFHYTRHVHPLQVVVTGMTRDGTFLIERGEIAYPVKNLRFTQSYLEALRNVVSVGDRTKLERSLFPFTRVPPLKIAQFNFTSSTEQG